MTDYGVLGVIYTSLQTALLACARYWLYKDNLRVSHKKMYLAMFAFACASAAIWFLIEQYVNIPFSFFRAAIALLMFVLSCFIIKEPFAKHAFPYAFIFAYDAVFEATASFVQLQFESVSTYVYVATALVIISLTFVPALRYLKRMIDSLSKIDNDKLWLYLCILCFSFLFMNLLFTFPPSPKLRVVDVVSRYLMFGGMCAIYSATVRVMQTMRDSAEMKADLSLTMRRIEAQQSYYDRLVTQMDEVRRMRHDLRHHKAAISAIIKSGDLSRLSEFVSEAERAEDSVPVSGNFVFDSLLLYYRDEAKVQKIDLQTDCIFAAPTSVSDPDMCVIFGNLLENAFEAQKYLEEGTRFISVLARSGESGFSLAVDNRYDGTLIQDGKVTLSRKEEGRSGVGLKSVQAVCDKYDGVFKTETDGDLYKAGVVILTH